jgi:hypothetical protein
LQAAKRRRSVGWDDNTVIAVLGGSLKAELSSQLARKKTTLMCVL